jgi:nitrite reductase/ring-hydroxylating ferredoxin subunit
MNRRNAFKSIAIAGASLAGLKAVIAGRAEASARQPATLRLSLLDPRFTALQQVNGTVEIGNSMAPDIQSFLPGGYPLALVRVDAATVAAVTKRCTHMGCQVDQYDGSRFHCPCHGSAFTGAGALAQGPATSPLQTFSVSFDGTIVIVNGLSGSNTWNLTSADDAPMPGSTALESNHPNPFRDETRIGYRLGEPEYVELTVYDEAGARVARLVEGPVDAGAHSVAFRPGPASSGFYTLLFRAGSYMESRRIARIK